MRVANRGIYGTVYTVKKVEDGYDIAWSEGHTVYPEYMVEQFINDGSWLVLEDLDAPEKPTELAVGVQIRQIRNFGRMFYPDMTFTVKSIMNSVAELSSPQGIGYIPTTDWKDYFEII